MKRLIGLAFALMVTYTAMAQTDVVSVPRIDYYGIDFSLARVYGASESKEQFQRTFNAINELVIHEYSKYNIGKAFKKEDVETLLEVTVKNNDAIDPSTIFTYDKRYELSNEQLISLVKQYDIKPHYKVGLVIVAGILNKSANYGGYTVVFFDTDSRDILLTKYVTGIPGGFGLRNYWARSVYNILKSWSYSQSSAPVDDLYR